MLLAVLLLLAALIPVALTVARSDRPAASRAGDTPGATSARDPAGQPSRDPSDEARAPVPPPVDLEAVDLDRDVHGVVVRRADGSPVAGAEVLAIGYPWRRANLLNVEGIREGARGPSTASATDGTFRLPLRRGELVGLRVRAAGLAPVEIPDVQAGERLRVELSPATRLDVSVKDERGAPVGGAEVTVFTLARVPDCRFRLTETTDAAGRCTFRELPPRVAARVEVSHVRSHSGWLKLTTPEGEGTFEVTLKEGRTIRGVVTDAATGRPVADAAVGLGWTMRRPVRTGEDGRYVFPGFTGEGVDELAAESPKYGQVRLKVTDAEMLDFALPSGGSVQGRAAGPDGDPLDGVIVAAIGGGTDQLSHRYAESGATGAFRLDGLRTDLPHRLILMKPGYARIVRSFTPTADLGTLTMPFGLSIEGRVEGGDAARVAVTLRSGERDGFYGTLEERRSDHLGRFRFPDLGPDTYRMEATREGTAPATTTVTLADRDVLDVVLRFEEGRRLVVLVEDRRGKPFEGAFVDLSHEHGAARAVTDVDGRAVFDVVGEIRWLGCSLVDAGHLPPPPPVTVAAGQSEVRIVLEDAGTARGTVVLPDGSPMPKAVVEVVRDGKRVTACGADGQGRFEAKVPLEGRVELVFHPMGGGVRHEGAIQGVVAGSEGLVLRLHELSFDRCVDVLLLASDGAPVSGFAVFAGNAHAKTAQDGRARIAGLSDQEVTVKCGMGSMPSGDVFPVAVRVVPRGQQVVLRFRKGAPVHGVLLGTDGAPQRRGAVTAWNADGPVSVAQADDEGRFTVYIPADATEPVWVECGARTGDGKRFSARADVLPGSGEIRLQLREE